MTKVLIAGIGNVLLSDDGVGPFVIKLLESQYDFPDAVELADLGTPGFDLPVHISSADAVILVDAANFGGEAGRIRVFRKHEILRIAAGPRINPHSPALTESLAQLELTGAMPRELLLIGMQGSCFELGLRLSPPVQHCVPHVIDAVRRELHRLNVGCVPKAIAAEPRIWWERAA
jgi:hydrogenase maturation protease